MPLCVPASIEAVDSQSDEPVYAPTSAKASYLPPLVILLIVVVVIDAVDAIPFAFPALVFGRAMTDSQPFVDAEAVAKADAFGITRGAVYVARPFGPALTFWDD